jgi:hypothetical protein
LAKVRVAVAHHATFSEAMVRLENLFRRIESHASGLSRECGAPVVIVEHRWLSAHRMEFRCAVLLGRLRAQGMISLKPHEVIFESDLPLAAILFRSDIESIIHSRLASILRV